MSDSQALNLGINFSEGSCTHDGNSVITVGNLLQTYKMDHLRRGKCIIFNHEDFSQLEDFKDRPGTNVDRQSLNDIFSHFGFEVKIYDDHYTSEIMRILENVSKEDHRDADCFVCCLLTHGSSDLVYSCDGSYLTEKLWSNFVGDKCPTLVGKPKLFFIQACQGNNVDTGVCVTVRDCPGPSNDLEPCGIRIPFYADFLIAYSSVPGHVSMRDKLQGSWFIQSLCDCLRKYPSEDIQTILTAVAYKLSHEYETTIRHAPAKQMPSFTSMLRKKLYLAYVSCQ